MVLLFITNKPGFVHTKWFVVTLPELLQYFWVGRLVHRNFGSLLTIEFHIVHYVKHSYVKQRHGVRFYSSKN